MSPFNSLIGIFVQSMKEKAMNKKCLLGLILFACLVIAGLYAGTTYFINLEGNSYADTQEEAYIPKDIARAEVTSRDNAVDIGMQEPWLTTNPSDNDGAYTQSGLSPTPMVSSQENDIKEKNTEDTFSTAIKAVAPELIIDSTKVDYMSYIPEIIMDRELEAAFNISNPSMTVDAEAAILFDAKTKEIIYYKNALQAVFPASTAKLLTSLVALKWCSEDEEVTIGDEITMIGSGSTIAYLKQGQILSIRNLLAGMLLPSGNDAAYAIAAYVGRKSLQKAEATKEEAVAEFIRLMNQEARTLGVKNSSFKTPDGYDAIGQYTTAYDMGLIGVAAANNELIIEITDRGNSRNIFPSGEDVTWYNTNKLVRKGYGQYYSKAIGLKTGTSTMAGKCLVAAAEEDGRKVVCAVMDSSSSGRWEDAIALLKYGLKRIE